MFKTIKFIMVITFVFLCKLLFAQVQYPNINLSPYYIQFFQDTAGIETKPVNDFKKKQHRILFKGGFESDSIKIYLDNKFCKVIKLESNKSTDNTNNYYDIFCSHSCRIKLIAGNECIDFSLFNDYKLVNISKHEEEWYITFSNYYWLSE